MHIHLPEGIANSFIALRSSTSKLQRTAGSLGFISKCLQRRLTPKFAIVSGAFKQESHRYAAVKKILHANYQEQQLKLRLHTAMCYKLKYEIINKYGRGAYKFIARLIEQQLSTERRNSLKTKNKKINHLLAEGNRFRRDGEYCVPIINLTDHELTDTEKSHLKFGLHHSFVDKSKYVKVNLATEFESLVHRVRNTVEQEELEDFHHFLRTSTNIFTKNIYNTPDNTWKSLRGLSENPNITVLRGDKDSTVVIIPREVYIRKLETMIEEGISQGKYETTNDCTLSDLKSFQDFLYRNFSKNSFTTLDLTQIRPVSNQPARLYATAKTHKFEDHKLITTENLKLRPIISTCGTYFYETAKALAKYLAPLAENHYTIKNTLDFADKLNDQTIEEDEIVVSYDVTSLFTEIPLDETINHIIDQIYNQQKLPQIAPRPIFKRLLERVTKGTTFTFNGKLYKQVDGCSMGNPLSPTLANIFMCKLEADVVTPLNLPFYNRYVDDCCTKRKANAPDILLENLNSYHSNIKFTVEENPDHFLDTAFTHQEGNFITKVHQKPGKLQVHWKSAIPHKWKRNTILGALHRAKRIATNWQEEVQAIKQSFIRSGYPAKFVNEVINDFENPTERDDETIIPVHWFDERTKIGIQLPFCRRNEFESRKFLAKVNKYTKWKFNFHILWQTRKIETLFKLKDKNIHPSHVIYIGTCTCNQVYIGETARNLEVRVNEHSDINKQSEPAKHLKKHPEHKFTWDILTSAHSWTKRKIKEAFYIARFNPVLNKQVQSFHLTLYPMGTGIT